MPKPHADSDWFTSSYSSNGSDCVEVRHLPEITEVRDTKNRPGATLAFPAAAWTTFLTR